MRVRADLPVVRRSRATTRRAAGRARVRTCDDPASPRSAGSRSRSSTSRSCTTFALCRGPHRLEMVGPVRRRAQGRHAVAPAPHRRALRAARDHHARRGHHRHRRVAQRGRARRGGLDRRRRAARRRRRRPHLRLLVDVLRGAVGGAAASATASGRSRFGYGHLVIFGALAAMGAGLHVAAYDLERRGEDRRRRRPCSAWRSRSRSTSPRSTALLAAACARATRSTSACWRARPALIAALGRARRGGRERRGLPARAHARAGRHRRRLRDARPPARRRGACADAAERARPAVTTS